MKLSIICPIYNAEVHLSDAIDSVISQTFVDWELILIDDGSTDSSFLICERYKKLDSRISIIHKKNEGQMRARIDGILKSNGEYILFLDSDDFFENGAFNKLISLINDGKNPDCVLFNAKIFNDQKLDESKILPKVNMNLLVDTNKDCIQYCFGNQMFGYLWMYCFKKEIFKQYDFFKNNFLDIRYTEDCMFLYNFLSNVKTIFVSNFILYKYRMNLNSITHNLNNKDRRDRFLVFDYIYTDIFNKYKNFKINNDLYFSIAWSAFSYLEHIDKKTEFNYAFKEVKKSIVYKKIIKKCKNFGLKFLLYKCLLAMNCSAFFYYVTRVKRK